MNFEGSIGEIDLIQRFVELGREHFTGAIRFEQDGIIKIIYFKGGDVLSASTNDRKDAIDEILLRAGKVGREHIKQALAKRQENETLGDALLNLGFITRKELTWARRVQVIGILRSVRAWTDGSYAIVADYLPKRDEGTIFPLSQIIVEFTVTEQDRASFDRAMDGGEAVFRKTSEFDAAFPALDLNEDAAEIVRHIDGEKSAAEIASVSGAETFNVYKLLEAMKILGLIEKGGGTSAESPAIAIPPADDFSFGLPDADASDGPAWTVAPRPRPPVAEQTPVPPPTTTGTVVDIAPSATASTATIATPVASAATASAPAKSRVEKQTGGRVITNVPAPSTAPDPGRGKYDAMARQYAQNPAGTYTVQFELVCQTPSLAKAIAAGGSNVWFVPVSYRGQSCYRVFWGHFDSRDAAIAAAARIPGALRGSNPVVVSVPRS